LWYLCEDYKAYTEPGSVKVPFLVQVGNITGRSGAGTLSAGGVTATVAWDAEGGASEFEVPLQREARVWDEFNPILQRLTLQLKGDQADDRRELIFGLREFRAEGNELVMNGRRTYLRGTHNGVDFPWPAWSLSFG